MAIENLPLKLAQILTLPIQVSASLKWPYPFKLAKSPIQDKTDFEWGIAPEMATEGSDRKAHAQLECFF